MHISELGTRIAHTAHNTVTAFNISTSTCLVCVCVCVCVYVCVYICVCMCVCVNNLHVFISFVGETHEFMSVWCVLHELIHV